MPPNMKWARISAARIAIAIPIPKRLWKFVVLRGVLLSIVPGSNMQQMRKSQAEEALLEGPVLQKFTECSSSSEQNSRGVYSRP